MCEGNWVEVITVFGNIEKFKIEKEVPQGSSISPLLFDIFLNPLFIKLEEEKLKIKIGERNISVLTFADDMVIIVESNEKL